MSYEEALELIKRLEAENLKLRAALYDIIHIKNTSERSEAECYQQILSIAKKIF